MSTVLPHRRKLRKSARKQPSGLEDEVARAIYDLEMNNRKLKNALTPLHINSAKEIDAGRSRRCVVVFYPLRFMRKIRKIQAVLGSELEKKFAGKQFVFISQRKIQQRPENVYKLQNMARSRTMATVQDSILDDLVFPADVVARRTRFTVDGNRQLKVYLDNKEKERVESRLDAFSAVYKRITGKDTVFGFMSNAALQQVA